MTDQAHLAGLLVAADFNTLSEPALDTARWLRSQGVDVAVALNVAGPIVEHSIAIFDGAAFDFAAPDDPRAVRAQIANPASYFAGKPLQIHRTPLGWLRACCQGIVVLSADGVLDHLDRLPARPEPYRLLAEDLDHGVELRRLLAPLRSRVRLFVPSENAACPPPQDRRHRRHGRPRSAAAKFSGGLWRADRAAAGEKIGHRAREIAALPALAL